jgi:hypothetical protein
LFAFCHYRSQPGHHVHPARSTQLSCCRIDMRLVSKSASTRKQVIQKKCCSVHFIVAGRNEQLPPLPSRAPSETNWQSSCPWKTRPFWESSAPKPTFSRYLASVIRGIRRNVRLVPTCHRPKRRMAVSTPTSRTNTRMIEQEMKFMIRSSQRRLDYR